jgi:hypothetical protein
MDLSNFSFEDLKINYSDHTKWGVPIDVNSQNIIETEPIKITGYGIPGLDGKYFPTDDKRSFIKLALDLNQQSCINLKKFLERGNEFFTSNELKKKLFKSNHNSWTFNTFVKVPYDKISDDDESDSKSNFHIRSFRKMDYVKIKLPASSKKYGKYCCSISLFLGDKQIMQNELLPLEEITKYVKFGATIKIKFSLTKIWETRTQIKSYGVTLCASEIRVIPSYQNAVVFSNPIYTIDEIKEAYKKYMIEQKKNLNRMDEIVVI